MKEVAVLMNYSESFLSKLVFIVFAFFVCCYRGNELSLEI